MFTVTTVFRQVTPVYQLDKRDTDPDHEDDSNDRTCSPESGGYDANDTSSCVRLHSREG